jgi:hypothetical protein
MGQIRAVFPTFSMEEPLKSSYPEESYENVYRPEKVECRERNSITATLLSRKFICKELLYSTISFLEEPDDVLWNLKKHWI